MIILLGEGEDVDSLRGFAQALVERPGARVEIWAERDVERLLAGRVAPVQEQAHRQPDDLEGAAETGHMGKYRALSDWLRQQDRSRVPATFSEMENILGFSLPPSARNHLAHWYGYKGTALGRAIRDAGWRASDVNLTAETLVFERE